MTTLKLIYPALAQIFWSFVVLTIMFLRRKDAFVNREVRYKDVAVSTEAYPVAARQAAANFTNQFETPVLFFVLVLIATHVGATGYVMTALAWAYVASRVVHTLIHIGPNRLPYRGSAFGIGVLCLLLMWLGVVLTLV
ncbi:MAPEG family protein [Bosea sp. TWI1241]|uniref:MAPEG family protein n=1 Tax=Bosea sp. TWI1241 TaxID=3148904 RepID=UPI003208BE5C